MKPVLDHYNETGQVLGKGTDLLEGYNMRDKGYYGPGELPHFNKEFFTIPHGESEDVLFEDLKVKIETGEISNDSKGDEALREFKAKVAHYISQSADDAMRPPEDA